MHITRSNIDSRTHYLFIDGGCLRAELARFGERYLGGVLPVIDYGQFSNGHTKTFYYDALPVPVDLENPTPEEAARLADALAEQALLRSLPDWHVYSGEVRGKKRRQKKVDILIAVHMLSHALRGNMEQATLLASDLDFEPLIDAMVQNGMTITLWHPTTKTVPELLHAADRVKPIWPDQIAAALLEPQKSSVALPSRHLANADPFGSAVAMKVWRDPRRGVIKLHRRNGNYVLVHANSPRDPRVLVAESSNLSLLTNYVEDIWGIRVPEN